MRPNRDAVRVLSSGWRSVLRNGDWWCRCEVWCGEIYHTKWLTTAEYAQKTLAELRVIEEDMKDDVRQRSAARRPEQPTMF